MHVDGKAGAYTSCLQNISHIELGLDYRKIGSLWALWARWARQKLTSINYVNA